MESKNLVYKYGHLYDPITKHRVELIDGAQICIVTDNGFAPFRPPGNKTKVINTEKEQEALLQNEFMIHQGRFSYYKTHTRGAHLYFSIKKAVVHEFKVELLEDLYFYLKKKWTNQEERLFECACVVKECTTNTIEFFEEVYATSLNEVYKTTFVHYFGNIGSPSSNAVERFYEIQGDENTSIEKYRKHRTNTK